MTIDKQAEKRKVVPFFDQSTSTSLPNLVISLSESKERIDQLREFVEETMVKGVDYGLVERFSKPTLLKPGAEKLCDVFGFSKTVNVINRIEDWKTGIFAYEVKITLTSKQIGIIEAEGIGSCNNKESSLRQQDPYTVVNTVLKMAKRRALIDAVLSATRASGLFTQDIEDFPKQQPAIKGGDELATKRQLHTIFRIGKVKAKQIIAALKLVHMNPCPIENRFTIRSPQDAYDYLKDIQNLTQEHFIVLGLNTKNEVQFRETIFISSLNASIVHPYECI